MTILAPAQPRPQYHRDPDKFVATSHGGFIPFAGEIRPWSWVRRNCACAQCGVPVGRRLSTVPADGTVRGAVYYECDGAEHHTFVREEDLKWRISRKPRDEEMRPGELKAVQEAYKNILTSTDVVEEIDW